MNKFKEVSGWKNPMAWFVPVSVAILVVACPLAQAQQLLGDRGASCVSIPAGGGAHSIALTGAIPSGATILMAVGTTGDATYSNTVDSSGANIYTPTNTVLSGFRSFSIHGRVSTALSAGQSVTINYSSASPSGQTSCASIAAFTGVAFSPVPPDDAMGSASGSSAAPSVSTTSATTAPRELVHAVFVLGGVANGIGVPPPVNPLQLVCVAGNSFCVIHGWRLVTSTGVYSASATLGSSVPWAANIVSYFSDVLFKDGFDG